MTANKNAANTKMTEEWIVDRVMRLAREIWNDKDGKTVKALVPVQELKDCLKEVYQAGRAESADADRYRMAEEIAEWMTEPCLRFKHPCGECLNCAFSLKAIKLRKMFVAQRDGGKNGK